MKRLALVSMALAVLGWGTVACRGQATGGNGSMHNLAHPDTAVWNAVAGQRIFFAHQSVGSNILQGLSELAATNAGRTPTVVHATDSSAVAGPAIYETAVGRNGDGPGKIDHFKQLVDGGFGAKVGIAIMKLCYVDIDERTDVQSLFDHYPTTLSELEASHPNVTFIHVTAPLQGPPAGTGTGFKQFLKNLLGKSSPGLARNAKREAFNQLMRTAYEGSEQLLDLAKFESTLPNGDRATMMYEGRAIPRLAAEYTHDGGHLNKLGRRIVAERFLTQLARIIKQRG